VKTVDDCTEAEVQYVPKAAITASCLEQSISDVRPKSN